MQPTILLKTCHINLNVDINIFILFEQLILNSVTSNEQASLRILGTRFQDQIRGNIREVKQSSHKKRKDFSNQCSVTAQFIQSENVTNVNFKVFNNGNIIITGMKHDNQTIKHAIILFLQNIISLTYVFEPMHNCRNKFLELFDNSTNTYSKFIHNHHVQLLKLMNTINDPVEIGIFDIIGKNYIKISLLDAFIDPIWSDDIYNFINIFFICYYYSSKNFVSNLENTPLEEIIRQKSETKTFPISFLLNPENIVEKVENAEIVIENINAIITFDFILDRAKFYNYIINNALNTTNIHNEDFVDFISFEQTMYQGINIKYKVDKSKYITMLIFQEGKVLISGTQNEDQLQIYSQKISKLINSHRTEYEIIKPNILPISTNVQLYPSLTADLNGKYVKIINYTKLIELNPRNYYIVKHIKFI